MVRFYSEISILLLAYTLFVHLSYFLLYSLLISLLQLPWNFFKQTYFPSYRIFLFCSSVFITYVWPISIFSTGYAIKRVIRWINWLLIWLRPSVLNQFFIAWNISFALFNNLFCFVNFYLEKLLTKQLSKQLKSRTHHQKGLHRMFY